ncbi:hypothetical protein EVAR_61710_1 [Eumeta japonica]|uniref:Uncharacterized protein n=1 Tax=Eumeta variegata TaxID=151549 RepID=A0A4C1ZKL7_EUMVA|nr:hypothetical protein EVAR_61710_1 [Eumeta japonica]
MSTPYSDIQFVRSGIFLGNPFALNERSEIFFGLRRPPKGEKLLHPGSRSCPANSEISELETAQRTAITVWISSANDEEPVAVAGGGTVGARRTDSLGSSWTDLGLSPPHGLVVGVGAKRNAAGARRFRL